MTPARRMIRDSHAYLDLRKQIRRAGEADKPALVASVPILKNASRR